MPVLNSVEDARKLKTIAVYRKSHLENYLRENGFTTSLVLTNNSDTSAKLLDAGRVDAWYASVHEARWLYKKGVLRHRIYVGQPILEIPIWAVASKGTKKALLDAIGREVELMKEDGSFSSLESKYGLSS